MKEYTAPEMEIISLNLDEQIMGDGDPDVQFKLGSVLDE